MSSRVQEKERRRQERVERESQLAAEARRQRRLWIAGGAVLLLALGVAIAASLSGGGGGARRTLSSSSGGPANRAPFGTHYSGLVARRTAAGVPTMMQTMNSPFHVHPLVAVFVNGRRITVPPNVGIDPTKDPMQMAGLHTHDASGTIHVEGVSGARLGQFFEIWGVPFSATQLGPYRTGRNRAVRMWVDGTPSHAFGQLPLRDRERIIVSYQDRSAGAPAP